MVNRKKGIDNINIFNDIGFPIAFIIITIMICKSIIEVDVLNIDSSYLIVSVSFFVTGLIIGIKSMSLIYKLGVGE